MLGGAVMVIVCAGAGDALVGANSTEASKARRLAGR